MRGMPAADDRLRLAELTACFAAACELAMGQSADHALHATVLALRLARAAGFDAGVQREVYYQAQLRFVGCNADTELIASIAGDVIALRQAVAPVDTADGAAMAATLLGRLRAEAAGQPWWQQVAAVLRGMLQAGRFEGEVFPGHCEVAQQLGRRLGFGERFAAGLGQLYARWDGRGVPAVAGAQLMPAVRVVTLAQDALLHHRLGGWDAVDRVLKARRAGQYDPALVDLALALGPAWLDALPGDWPALFALEPAPQAWLEGEALDAALQVLADHAEIQSPWLLGHGACVAALAAQAGAALQLPPPEQRALRRAALLHDVGRVGVPAGVWARPGPLSASERDRVRLHSHYSQQILGRAPALQALARLAASAHERLDGSGYARALPAEALPPAARVLAAADLVAALSQARPHRAALAPPEIERTVADEVRAGRIDASAARAVLAAAGLGQALPATARAARPAGLSEREAEVLGQLARGRTNKQIAQRLGISPKTVGHHLESIYGKTGQRTRAGATAWAIGQRLVASD